jgi:hypothetical protein
MHRIRTLTLTTTLATALLITGGATRAAGQSTDPSAASKATTEQQKQLDQLKQLEEQLYNDRVAMHAAITQHGWDSDEADAAREQLFRDRQEFRKIRRSLCAAGVAVPPPARLWPGIAGRRAARLVRGGHWHDSWRQPGRRVCRCPCAAF